MQIQVRRGTAANWIATNPTLSDGEYGWETDTRRMKIGDGATAWNDLLYWVGEDLTTDVIPEGTTNKYFTAARAVGAVLAGFAIGTAAAVSDTDTVIGALEKHEAAFALKADLDGADFTGSISTTGSINKVTLTAPATGATLTLADNSTLATAGAHAITFTSTGATTLTLPSTGTLATRAGNETFTNKTISGSLNTLTNIPNAATTATSANTANAIVVRDASGNFSMGPTLTMGTTGNGGVYVNGNTAATLFHISRTTLEVAGTDRLAATSSGVDVTGNLSLTGNVTAGTWQGTQIANAYIATITTAGKVANSATTATDANTANAIVARDASGNFSAGTITAALTGTASNASQLLTKTWAAPDAIGSGTPAAGTFTALRATGNLIVDGDLLVSGDTITVNTSTVSVEDPLVKYASANVTDAVDIGFYALYQPASTPLYTGFFRDATDGKFKLFSGLQAEPGTTVNIAGTGYTTAALLANTEGTHTGSVVGNASTATALATARAINGVNFDGTAAITVTAAADTLSGSALAVGVTASSLTSLGTITALSAGTGGFSDTITVTKATTGPGVVSSVVGGQSQFRLIDSTNSKTWYFNQDNDTLKMYSNSVLLQYSFGTSTFSITPAVTMASTLAVSGAIQPKATPNAAWGIDFASTNAGGNNYIPLANNGTYDLPQGDGLIQLHCDETGYPCLFQTGGGLVGIVTGSDLGSYYSNASGTSGKVNVFYNAGFYRIENKTGGAIHLYVTGIRTRFST